MFSVTLLTTTIHLINLNESSMDHFTKVSLPDFTDLHMTLAFIEEQKSTAGEGAEWRAIISITKTSFYLDYCAFINVGDRNRN